MWMTWCGVALAGPWIQPPGEAFAKVGVGRFSGQAAFDTLALTTRTDSVEVYGEVGLGRGVELDLSTAWVAQHAGDQVGRGLQDIEVLAEWGPDLEGTAVALVGGARIAPYRRGQIPQLGPGGADLLLGAGWGRSYGPGWGSVDALLRYRIGAPSSGLRLRTEWGAVVGGIGGALTMEIQPASGRGTSVAEDVAPVPRVWGLGVKSFVAVVDRVGLTADAVWLPALFNDGPGTRVGAGVTWGM